MNYFENKVTELRKLITMSLSKEERKAVEKLLREVAKDQREFSARAVHYWYGDDETPSDEGLLDHILKWNYSEVFKGIDYESNLLNVIRHIRNNRIDYVIQNEF
jgi:hypothetical protein